MSYSLAELAEKIDGTVHGDGTIQINSLSTLINAGEGQIAFLSNSKYRQQLAETNASAVIINEDCLNECQTNAIVMKNPYLGYALVAQLLDTTPLPAYSIHPSAVIADSAIIGENVSIGANAVIDEGARIADGASIGAGCFIGRNAQIGAHTKIWANVTIYHEVELGEHCLVQANTIIGSDGFGYANHQGQWHKIPQLGSVIIGNRVEIGASTTIDRGALGNTEIHDGVIIDNQIQIAHNVIVGENTAIAACSVVAGSTEIGKNCTIAGMVAINGHIKISDGSVFTGMSMVTKPTREPGVYSSGIPAQPNRDWHKMNAHIRKLPAVNAKIKQLEQEIAQLKSGATDE
ncbi:UDP-3-O-(3-hydroxymyristoyl)glucosamine N-acyltransferase [Thalassotalea fusca]